jgi:molybdopterin molybdotransferase
MLTVQEATAIIHSNLIPLTAEYCLTRQAFGRVLQENITADRPIPPFDRVTMDGIVIRFSAWEAGQRRFKIAATQFAGKPQITLDNPAEAIEIMTGAVCPLEADTVIRYEDLAWETIDEERFATIQVNEIQFRQNIHPEGNDQQKGDVLLETGTRLGTPEIAIAVSVGKATLKVKCLPRIAVISTGDELVETVTTPLIHQIRRSNTYALLSVLQANHYPAQAFHWADDVAVLTTALKKILAEFDVLILSGGVSEGKADFVPQVLTDLGVQKLFHKVRQRPGKPFWFGRTAAKAVFALPGNPVSTMMCFYRYAIPYLQALQGQKPRSMYACLAQDIRFMPDLTYFLPVRIACTEAGILQAQPYAGSGSGDYANLRHCDGFLELPAERNDFKAGEALPWIGFR